jgi:hypothetical protein
MVYTKRVVVDVQIIMSFLSNIKSLAYNIQYNIQLLERYDENMIQELIKKRNTIDDLQTLMAAIDFDMYMPTDKPLLCQRLFGDDLTTLRELLEYHTFETTFCAILSMEHMNTNLCKFLYEYLPPAEYTNEQVEKLRRVIPGFGDRLENTIDVVTSKGSKRIIQSTYFPIVRKHMREESPESIYTVLEQFYKDGNSFRVFQ